MSRVEKMMLTSGEFMVVLLTFFVSLLIVNLPLSWWTPGLIGINILIYIAHPSCRVQKTHSNQSDQRLTATAYFVLTLKPTNTIIQNSCFLEQAGTVWCVIKQWKCNNQKINDSFGYYSDGLLSLLFKASKNEQSSLVQHLRECLLEYGFQFRKSSRVLQVSLMVVLGSIEKHLGRKSEPEISNRHKRKALKERDTGRQTGPAKPLLPVQIINILRLRRVWLGCPWGSMQGQNKPWHQKNKLASHQAGRRGRDRSAWMETCFQTKRQIWQSSNSWNTSNRKCRTGPLIKFFALQGKCSSFNFIYTYSGIGEQLDLLPVFRFYYLSKEFKQSNNREPSLA